MGAAPASRQPAPSGTGSVHPLHWSVPGRTRYLIPGLYRYHPLKGYLESRLKEDRAILSSSANILTGHLLVLYPPGIPPGEIGALVQSLLAEFNAGAPPEPPPAPGPAGRVEAVSLRGRKQKPRPWHVMAREAVAAHFATSPAGGLTTELFRRRLKRYGPNLLPETPPRSPLAIFLGQLKSLPVILLVASALLSLCTAGIADAVAIISVVLINAVIGYLTESRAERTINSLKSLAPPTALVVRDGTVREVRSEEVVPGDLLVLRPGSRVAADARIIESHSLSIDESALTGESMPVAKNVEALSERVLPLGDRFNMAYQGTVVTGGQGRAVAVGTGRCTEIGRVKELAGEAVTPGTPMERELDRVGRRLVVLYGGVCGVVFLAGLWRGFGILRTLRTTISLAVAAIPEGLPTVATTILAIGVSDMKRQKILIRHLSAAETLGRVQTVCLDKTGTPTENRMSVVSLHCGMRQIRRSEGRFFAPEGEVALPEIPELARLLEALVLCNESEVAEGGEGVRLSGSATENALMELALAAGTEVARLRESHPPVKTVLRSGGHNYMLTVHPLAAADSFPPSGKGGDGARLVAVKGAPGEVLSLCNRQLLNGRVRELSDEERVIIELANERMAGGALRVLGAAYAVARGGPDPEGAGEVEEGLVWLGLVGMADPLRAGVKELMGVFHRAGVETVMITGDQLSTAYAIGNELGLSRGGALKILDSAHLQEMDLELLAAVAPTAQIFARVSPAQKLQIVQALQKGGRVVAMTGDGINDGPALKAADVGIAMGSAGTDVAREVADVVLEEDDLKSMILAMSHGRTIYDNIRKAVRFLLATNLSEITVMLLSVAGGLGEPLNAMQLLWINLISDIFPGLALALEPTEPDVMERPPADPRDGVVSDRDFAGIAWQGGGISAGALAAYCYALIRYGFGERAGAIAFMSLTSGQLLQALSCRSEKRSLFSGEPLPPNRYLSLALTGSFALQGSTLLVPGLRRLLRLSPVGLMDALVILGGSLFPLFASEGLKPWNRKVRP